MSDYKPGLYFVSGAGAECDGASVHVELCVLLEVPGDDGVVVWHEFDTDMSDDKPNGDILSGPHTAEELLALVRQHLMGRVDGVPIYSDGVIGD